MLAGKTGGLLKTGFIVIFLAATFLQFKLPLYADDIACGSTISTSVKLDNNLKCSGAGLIIGADNITLDLNGHTVTGDGKDNDIGIDNRGGFVNINIKNGKVERFAYGLYFTNASLNTISNMEIRENKNISGSEGIGIMFWLRNRSNTVSKSEISGNDRQGIYIGCNPYIFDKDESGCRDGRAENNILMDNTIAENGKAGFDAYGIQMQYADNTIVMGNTIKNHRDKKRGGFGPGLYIISGRGNTIEKNILEGNDFGAILWNQFAESAKGNTFTGNKFSSNSDTGLWVLDGTSETVVWQNEVYKNGFGPKYGRGDGINTSGNGVTIKQNNAYQNRDLGIEASGAIDGGGNISKNNGASLQCSGVVCEKN